MDTLNNNITIPKKTKERVKVTQITVKVAMSTAIIMLTTMISMPVMMGGYIHLGDAAIFLSCIFLSWWAIPAAALGSAFADMILGYAYFAPGTLIIKAVMALIARLIIGKCSKNKPVKMVRMIIAFVVASIFMQVAYLGYQYGVALIGYETEILSSAAYLVLINFLFGCIQSVVDVPIAVVLGRKLYATDFLYINHSGIITEDNK